MVARLVLSLSLSLLFSCGIAFVALADVAGSLTIAGNGPELRPSNPLLAPLKKPTQERISMLCGMPTRNQLRWSNPARLRLP